MKITIELGTAAFALLLALPVRLLVLAVWKRLLGERGGEGSHGRQIPPKARQRPPVCLLVPASLPSPTTRQEEAQQQP